MPFLFLLWFASAAKDRPATVGVEDMTPGERREHLQRGLDAAITMMVATIAGGLISCCL